MRQALIELGIALISVVSFASGQNTIGSIKNSGDCSFTVINAKDSAFKVTCGGKALSPEEARELSQLLSIAKSNDIKLSELTDGVRKLAEEKANRNNPSLLQNCTDAFCNAGSVQAPQTLNDYRQFGARLPGPNVMIVRKKQYLLQ